MSAGVDFGGWSRVGLSRGRCVPAGGEASLAIGRLPTDPLFYSNITLQNIVVGSRYWIALQSDETVLASGTAAATEEVIPAVPCYASSQLLLIRVRYASSTTRYVPLTTYATQTRDGAQAYIAQVIDPTS